MKTTTVAAPPPARAVDNFAELRRQYGCGPVEFTGTDERALRAAPALRQRRQTDGRRPARTFRGLRPLRAGYPLAALGAHRGHLRAREPQARLLSLDGVSHRPLAGQQCHEPPARSRRQAGRQAEEPRLARAARSRNPTPAWATAGSGAWRPASSIRWPRCSSRPWAMACATNTASSGRPSRTAGNTNSRTTGSAARTPGRSRARTRRWKSS